MDNQQLSEQQEQYKRGEIERAMAFEEIQNTKGFESMRAYYENLLREFVNEMMNQESRPLSDFESQRQRLIGIKKLFQNINSSMEVLKNERTKPE